MIYDLKPTKQQEAFPAMLPAHAALVKTCNGAHTPTGLNFMRSVVTLCSGQKHIWHLTYTSRSRSVQRTETERFLLRWRWPYTTTSLSCYTTLSAAQQIIQHICKSINFGGRLAVPLVPHSQ